MAAKMQKRKQTKPTKQVKKVAVKKVAKPVAKKIVRNEEAQVHPALVFEATDNIIGQLVLPNPCAIRIELITGTGGIVKLFIGPRDYQWNGVTGELVACGTKLVTLPEEQDEDEIEEEEQAEEAPTLLENTDPEPLENDDEKIVG